MTGTETGRRVVPSPFARQSIPPARCPQVVRLRELARQPDHDTDAAVGSQVEGEITETGAIGVSR